MTRIRPRSLDREAILNTPLSASAPDDAAPPASEQESRPVTQLDVLTMQVRGIMHQCATVLATIDAMQRRPVTPAPRPAEPDERPATFGRKQDADDLSPEADHGKA